MQPAAATTMLILWLSPALSRASAPPNPIEPLAESFVSLALEVGRVPGHETEVDSYFGPPNLMPTAGAAPRSAAELAADASHLVARIDHEQALHPTPRGARLSDQAHSLAALLRTSASGRSFAQEAAGVYDMTVPEGDPEATRRALAKLAALLPGRGDVADRLETYRERFVISPQRRRAVFLRALAACRKRTEQHWRLPTDERVEVTWSQQVPAAWQRYRGSDRSTLQINPDAVAWVEQSLDVACHEAYPGHHAQFLLLAHPGAASGPPLELTIALLHSPASVLREGAADVAVDLAFPLEERVAFDKAVLFPLAHLPSAEAERYEQVNALVRDLSVAAAPILAAYRDGRLDVTAAFNALRSQALIGSPSALLRFADAEGAYTLGYTAARDRVRAYVRQRSVCSGEDPWQVLAAVVAVPEVALLHEAAPRCPNPAGAGG